MNARKEKIDPEAAWALLSQAERVHIVNGRRLSHFTPTPDQKEAILQQAIGRSGSLRAPALRVNNQVIIGYDEALYRQLLTPA